MDTDKDGMLSLPELLKDMEQWGEGEEDKQERDRILDLETRKFKAADVNKDTFLTVEELPALFYPETHDDVLLISAEATLGNKDLNKYGKLSEKEFWEGDTV